MIAADGFTKAAKRTGGSAPAPKPDDDPSERDPADTALFAPRNLGQRIDYAARVAIGFAERQDRRHLAFNPDATALARMRNAMTTWYGARALSREAFRERFLDPSASDELVDRLRSAARLAVEGRSHAELGQAGAALAGVMQRVGLGNWRRFTAHAEERAIEAVSRGEVPGVVKASAESAGIGLGAAVLLFLGTLYFAGRTAEHDGAPSPEAPGIVRQDKPDEANKPPGDPKPDGAASKPSAAPAGPAIITDERRQHILDGDKTGGGHRPGTGKPGKTEFPAGWSDNKIIEAIKEVADDPKSDRQIRGDGATVVEGMRDGVEIRVILEPDGRTVRTAHPINLPRNQKGNVVP